MSPLRLPRDARHRPAVRWAPARRAPGRCGPGAPAERLSSKWPIPAIIRSPGAGVSAITSELARLSGPLAYLVVAALVFGETALFFGFVLPGEIAVVLGGVLASRGRVSLPLLIMVVVAAAIIGPLRSEERR